jgi:hypothetical protein
MLGALELRGQQCVEVGVCEGEFSAEILRHEPARLHLVDPWASQSKEIYPDDHSNVDQPQFDAMCSRVRARFAERQDVEIIRNFSMMAARRFADASLDFAYIDSIHTMESVLADAVTWYPKVKHGGWLCGHDYGKSNYLGVKYGVDAFCRLSGERLGLLTMENWGSWGLRKST